MGNILIGWHVGYYALTIHLSNDASKDFLDYMIGAIHVLIEPADGPVSVDHPVASARRTSRMLGECIAEPANLLTTSDV